MKCKRIIIVIIIIMMGCGVVGCNVMPKESAHTEAPTPSAAVETPTPILTASPSPIAKPQKVGISLPTKSLKRWESDGTNMEQQFKALGYEVDLQYAEDDVPVQITQIKDMITNGCDVLVIRAIDDAAMTEVLVAAKTKGIPVISYDRLIMGTDATSYYVTFDNQKVGEAQGEYIVKTLNINNTEGSFNIELFTGAPDDSNVNFFYGGAMRVLWPYIESGKLVVPSGQTETLQVATENWSTEEAYKRMKKLISSQKYAPIGTKLDAVLCSNDSVAQGVVQALLEVGYTADNFPVITGQDCAIQSVKNIIAGTQAMSVIKDTRAEVDRTVAMISSIFNGEEPEVNDTEDIYLDIPTYLCDPVVVTRENYREILIDSGYYTEDEIND